MSGAGLPLRHLMLALAVVAIWGSNCVVIKVALSAWPPLTLGSPRFLFAVLPAVFFLAISLMWPRIGRAWRQRAAG